MKKTVLLSLTLPVVLSAQNAQEIVYCDKSSLPAHKINSPEYADCIQPDINYTKDEKLVYKVPGDCCTPAKMKVRKAAIEKMKNKGEWVPARDCCTETENLAYSVPDYDKWSIKEIREYENAINAAE